MGKSEINSQKFENEIDFSNFQSPKVEKKLVKLLDFSFWVFNK
jgi:hypothetical protein